MPNLDEVLAVLREKQDYLHEKYHVSRMGVFGSVARREETPDSDVDLLVDFDGPVGMFKFIDLADELELTLNSKVDLATFGGIRPYQWDFIKNDVVYI